MRQRRFRERRSLLAVIAVLAFAGCTAETPGAFQGYVEGEFVHVASGVGGRLQRLHVERGRAVAANDPLFELESSQQAAALQQATQALNAAEAELADIGTGRRSAEIEVVRAQLEQARTAASRSALQLARDAAQLEAGGIARTQLETSQAQHDINVARVRELESQIEVAELSGRPEQIRAQTAMVASARAAAEQSRWRYEETRIAAMQPGIVIDTLYREGEWVPQGSPVVRMLPPDDVKIRFFVPQQELSRLPLGRRLTIRCDGCPATVDATVSYSATEPEYTPPIIYSNESRSKLVFMVEARPADSSGPVLLRPGQPVEVVVP